jgi:hypothetical protein
MDETNFGTLKKKSSKELPTLPPMEMVLRGCYSQPNTPTKLKELLQPTLHNPQNQCFSAHLTRLPHPTQKIRRFSDPFSPFPNYQTSYQSSQFKPPIQNTEPLESLQNPLLPSCFFPSGKQNSKAQTGFKYHMELIAPNNCNLNEAVNLTNIQRTQGTPTQQFSQINENQMETSPNSNIHMNLQPMGLVLLSPSPTTPSSIPMFIPESIQSATRNDMHIDLRSNGTASPLSVSSADSYMSVHSDLQVPIQFQIGVGIPVPVPMQINTFNQNALFPQSLSDLNLQYTYQMGNPNPQSVSTDEKMESSKSKDGEESKEEEEVLEINKTQFEKIKKKKKHDDQLLKRVLKKVHKSRPISSKAKKYSTPPAAGKARKFIPFKRKYSDMSNEENEEEKKSGETKPCCSICFKEKKLLKAKCKHECCVDCWLKWLDQQKRCPFCRKRTRLTHLHNNHQQQPPSDQQTPKQSNQSINVPQLNTQ